MAIKIEQYQKTADGSYQLMYPKTQADCVSVSSGGNLQTKLNNIDKKVTYELTCNKTGSTYALSSFPSVTGLVSCVFKAVKDYAPMTVLPWAAQLIRYRHWTEMP